MKEHIMIRQQGFRAKVKSRQHGAVAIIVALSLVVLIGMLGLVIDLGHLYVTKTELQNAADAAALSGAKELDGTLDGVNAASASAIEAARRNKYDLNAKVVTITGANIEYSNSPDGPWVGLAAAQARPDNKTFLKVDTGSQSLNTWFIHVVPGAPSSTATFGMAVAGYYVVDVAPIGICAVDKDRQEHGFIRGVAYNVPRLNPLVINADPMWINPVNAPPDACGDVDPQWNSSDKMAAFVCTGRSSVIKSLPGEVFVNPGGDAALGKQLNSRFDDYQGSKCDVATAPPDANVKEYKVDDPTKPPPQRLPAVPAGGCPASSSDPACGHPRDWMEPSASIIPSQQGITVINSKPVDKTVLATSTAVRTATAGAFQDYGPLWTYSREKNFSTGGDHTLDDWCGQTDPLLPCSLTSLYKGRPDQTASGYSVPVPAASSPPYFQTSGNKYFRAPPNNPTAGVRDRRVLNLVIIDCSVPAVNQVGPGNKCAALPTLAVGKFFMTVPADLPNHELYVEFVKLLSTPLPPAEVKLYR
jgi:Flp pilus assembly protein TadG